MSRGLNHVFLIGNLTRDPELRATSTGKEVCRFSLAVNRSYKNSEGEWQDTADFVDVTAWEGLASIVQNYCHKGKQVAVQGSLRSSSWEQDGQTRSKLEVSATNVLLLGEGKPQAGQQPDQASQPKTSASKKETKETVDYEAEGDFGGDQFDPADMPF